MQDNIKNGLPIYHGMNIQYTIAVKQLEGIEKYSPKIISELKNMSGFIDFSVDNKNKTIIIRCLKENSSESFSIIKEILDRNRFPAVDYTERVYKN